MKLAQKANKRASFKKCARKKTEQRAATKLNWECQTYKGVKKRGKRKASEISNFLNVQHFYKSRWPGEVFRLSCAQHGLTLYGSSFKTAQQPPLRTYREKDVMAGRLFLGSWFAFCSLKKQKSLR